ncbi:MAG: hypothetical protein IJ530_00170 [Treponema sp.]|uniref:hypothetical protein n=1 Tax=Treponema sp. TaxID=166 RepID=UPI0025F67088|nr:hypothetical protein [Treponema sp.]MBQ8678160.1 hypothetical protein [Treponema sp.]
MKKIFHLILTIFFINVFFGCASTKIESVKNPEINFSDYKNVLIFGNTQDLTVRKLLENNISKELKKVMKKSSESIDIISPLKEWSETEIQNAIENNNFDLLLNISITSSSSNTGSSSNFMMPVGSFYFGGSSPEIKLTMTFNVNFFDVRNKENIAKASIISQAEEDEIMESMESISKDVAKKIVEEFFSNTTKR